MGVQWTVAQILLWVIVSSICYGKVTTSAIKTDNYDNINICETPGCKCTKKTEWQVINCTFDTSKDINIRRGSVPDNALEMYITGGKLVTIYPLSFQDLRGFELLRFDNTKLIDIKEQAFDTIGSSYVLDVQVYGCNYFLLNQRAFKNMLASVRTEIIRCESVDIRKGAFGRLQEAKLQDINQLNLSEDAFLFENQTERGRHGVVTNISFHNVTIPKIPERAFVSALSSIVIRDSNIEQIDAQAFAATEISSILIYDSKIGRLHSKALSERTWIKMFLLRSCMIDTLESQAFMAAISNLTIEFSTINRVEKGAIDSQVTANIIISNNKFTKLAPNSFVFRDWNRIVVEENIIQYLEKDFLCVPYNPDVVKFSFSKNEIYNVEAHAFDSIPELQKRIVDFKFEDNSFHEDCRCGMDEWMSSLMNNSVDVELTLKTSYCKISAIIANCFKIQQDLISMANYTQLVCGPGKDINCEPYNGITKPIRNNTFFEDEQKSESKLLLLIILVGLLILAVAATVVILLIRGALWLRRKGYCMRYQYENDEVHAEDEGAMVVDEAAFDCPELTNELLQNLREQLKNPETHDKAREMIEALYERFVIEDSYTNNNRQEEEAHLYEELGNMQSGHVGGVDGVGVGDAYQRTDDFLKVMEEKINFPLIDADFHEPVVNQQYSEPADAAIHVYSELKNKGEEEEKKNSLLSNGSLKMALRPLPDKPGEPGPSTKKY